MGMRITRVAAVRVARAVVACVSGMAGIVGMAPGVIAVATSYALERHGQEAGSSQEQRECVQVHVSIEP